VRTQATAIALGRGHTEAALVADEGGLGIPFASNEAALELLADAIESAGLVPGSDVSIAVDAAATEFSEGSSYHFRCEGRTLSADQLIAEYARWVRDYPILSIEDPLAEDDWAGWVTATAKLRDDIDLVGDDLFVTQRARLERGIAEKAANSILIKVNQNGLVSRTQSVLGAAKTAGYRTIVSARSGETEDAWLADLAVGWNAQQIKVGSTHRSERTAKWNRLLQLEATTQTRLASPWSDARRSEQHRFEQRATASKTH